MKARRSTGALRARAALAASCAASLLLVAEPRIAPSWRAPVALAAAAALAPDAEVQAEIAAVARATSEQEVAAALVALRASAAPDFSDLVPQLALFLLDAEGERAGMTPALIVSRLGVSRGQILRALEPHLDTPDARLREQLENLLGAVELEDVRRHLAERGAPPPDALVRYLYARSPVDAVTVLRDAAGEGAVRPEPVLVVEETRAALAGGRATDEQRTRAAIALGGLSRDPDWRLRAYAAAVLRAETALAAADGEALARLAADRESRVRTVARGSAVAAVR